MTNLLRLLMGLEAFTFLVGSALHSGVSNFGLSEPRIPPATLVEALCGAALAIGALAYGPPRGMLVAVGAHMVAIGGVLLGMGALAAGRGPATALNTMYHRTILVSLFVTAALVLIDRGSKRAVTL